MYAKSLSEIVRFGRKIKFIFFVLQNERNVIMQVVCEATQVKPENKVCVTALQCLVNIMSLYYQFMEPYMRPALFPVSKNFPFWNFSKQKNA